MMTCRTKVTVEHSHGDGLDPRVIVLIAVILLFAGGGAAIGTAIGALITMIMVAFLVVLVVAAVAVAMYFLWLRPRRRDPQPITASRYSRRLVKVGRTGPRELAGRVVSPLELQGAPAAAVPDTAVIAATVAATLAALRAEVPDRNAPPRG
jgi:hypothetical protein